MLQCDGWDLESQKSNEKSSSTVEENRFFYVRAKIARVQGDTVVLRQWNALFVRFLGMSKGMPTKFNVNKVMLPWTERFCRTYLRTF